MTKTKKINKFKLNQAWHSSYYLYSFKINGFNSVVLVVGFIAVDHLNIINTDYAVLR